jgi:hypothetical protein
MSACGHWSVARELGDTEGLPLRLKTKSPKAKSLMALNVGLRASSHRLIE